MRERGREAKEARINSALTAWLQGAGGQKSWRDFCVYYGLTEKEAVKLTKEQRQTVAKNAYEFADKLVAKLTKGK
jgi:hypothetical protein